MEESEIRAAWPSAWLGLYDALCGADPQLAAAERWLQEVRGSSQWGGAGALSWSALMEALLGREPVLRGAQFSMEPLVLHLHQYYQKLLLAFLHHHRSNISEIHLKKLVNIYSEQPNLDPWIKLLVQMLQGDQKSKSGNDSAARFVVSEENRGMFSTLLGKLKEDTKRVKDSNKVADAADEDEDRDSPVFLTQPPVIDDINTPNVTAINSSQQVLTHTGRKGDQSSLLGTPKSSWAHRSFSQRSQKGSVENADEEIELQALKLRDAWLSAERSSVVPEEISVFTSTTQQQLGVVLRVLELGSLPEPSLAVACSQLAGRVADLPYSHAARFAGSALLPKLISLEQNCSRVLLEIFISFTKLFGKQMLESVLVPALQNAKFDSPHADLINKLLKEIPEVSFKQQFLQQACDADLTWNDSVILLLQAVVDTKVSLSGAPMCSLVGALARNAPNHTANLKYGKLLLAVINKHTKELDPDHTPILTRIVLSHTTFLKKSLSNALKKL